MKLLQHSWSDMLVLDHLHHRIHNGLPDETQLNNGQVFNLMSLGLLGVPQLGDYFNELQNKLQDLKFDMGDYVCMKFLILLNPREYRRIEIWIIVEDGLKPRFLQMCVELSTRRPYRMDTRVCRLRCLTTRSRAIPQLMWVKSDEYIRKMNEYEMNSIRFCRINSRGYWTYYRKFTPWPHAARIICTWSTAPAARRRKRCWWRCCTPNGRRNRAQWGHT